MRGLNARERGCLWLAALVVFAVLAGLAIAWLLVHVGAPVIIYLLQAWPWPPPH